MDEKRIEAAAKELVNALDRCADVINGAFKFAAIHVADYTDAVKLIYGKELDALKRALAGEGEQASPACGDWGQGVSDTNPKALEGAIAIPEDLREQYDLHKKWLAIPWHERPRGTASVQAILRENAVNDIERIASLTQRAELAESRVKELDWQRITPENLPKVGDEVWSAPYSSVFYPDSRGTVYAPEREDDLRPYLGWVNAPTHAFTHFRPISAPAPDGALVGGKEGER